MATAKRRINSTGRKRIARESVDIRLAPLKPAEPQAATASFRVEETAFPPSASIVLEAYQRSSSMRFECGTVGDPETSKVMVLDELDRATPVLFRLKVVEGGGTGKILGAADRIRPAGNENEEGKRSIFPIKETDLGPELWRVSIDDSGPWLLLNYRIPSFKHRILDNPMMRGLILPAALRIVLEHLVEDHEFEDDDDEDWRALWLRYLREACGIEDDLEELKEEIERQEWVDTAVRKFCEAHDFVELIRAADGGA
ncbi:hypothetical protein [Bradyrhizobium vignae]|uniref:Uncharacterized protein n=1 Tax=Bradyrhizobium vignae TaxID=1549949 RepID=A0ABS4A1U3_9BRAD|nr:hypothetical protein [Bradyrhizobium vignae]MBP0114371.1 hypothetical protein [Bradyrhizobium vignae]